MKQKTQDAKQSRRLEEKSKANMRRRNVKEILKWRHKFYKFMNDEVFENVGIDTCSIVYYTVSSHPVVTEILRL